MIANPWIALILTFLAALAWLRSNDAAAQRGWVSGRTSRKMIHIGTGPIFVLCWLLFPEESSARYLAALVPLAFTIQFALIGLSVIRDEASVRAMSRSGDPQEILRGPLYYGIVFVVLTVLYWKDSPTGITALMLLCGGDGMADLIGRRWGRARLPWSRGKTWVGSFGMLAGGWTFAVGILGVYLATEQLPGSLSQLLPAVSLISLAGTLVESLPLEDIDNVTITLTAVILGQLFF